MFSKIEKGKQQSTSYRMYMANNYGKVISPLHDIPLYANQSKNIFNIVIKMPRWTNEKLNIAESEPLNPIKYETKNGEIEKLSSAPPYHGGLWNYGIFPQTGSFQKSHPSIGIHRNKQSLEVFELGEKILQPGDVVTVKILAALPLIVNDELNWKILALNTSDPFASKVNDVNDLLELHPRLFQITVECLSKSFVYGTDAAVKYGNKGRPKTRAIALKILREYHGFWKALITGFYAKKNNISTSTTTIVNSPYFMQHDMARRIVDRY